MKIYNTKCLIYKKMFFSRCPLYKVFFNKQLQNVNLRLENGLRIYLVEILSK